MSLRVMVTGASGFVGRAFCDACAKHGNTVVAASRTAQAYDGSGGSVTPVAVGDIAQHADWRVALQGVDAVVHLAARTSASREDGDEALSEFRRVNTEATMELARQTAQAGVKRFVFLSSVKVNGELTPPGQAFTSDDIPAPEDAYGISKLEAERALRDICARMDMELVVIRPPLVYGPGVRGNFQAMIRMIQRGIPLPLGAIHNCRSLVALDNLVDLISTCLSHPAAANQIFMAADGDDVSTSQLLRKVAAAYGVPARLVPVPASLLRLGATVLGKRAVADRLLGSLKIDVCKTRDVLGWTPIVSMDEQLKKMAR